MSGDFYQKAVMPLLLRLDPELAHNAALTLLRHGFPWRSLSDSTPNERLQLRVGPWLLESPIGLAAGLDKNGECLPGLQRLGMDFIGIGSVTQAPSQGNPKPRLMRLPESASIINCYGLPSSGIDEVERIFRDNATKPRRSKIIANVHAETCEGFTELATRLAPFADGLELALRCPNLGEASPMFPIPLLSDLLASVRDRLPDTPIFLKIPPFDTEAEEQNRLDLVLEAINFGLTGVTIPGTYTSGDQRLSRGSGSVSGRLTFSRTLNAVKSIASISKGRIAIKASGGIHTGADALDIIVAGASMIEVFTAVIYRGWNVAAKLRHELAKAMDDRGIMTLSGLRHAT